MECLETAFVTSRVWQTRVSRWSVWQMTFVTSSVAGVFPQRLVTFRSYSPSKAVGCVDTRLSHSYSAARQVHETLWNLRVFAAPRGTFGNGYRVTVDAFKEFCMHSIDGKQSAICLDFSRHCLVKQGLRLTMEFLATCPSFFGYMSSKLLQNCKIGSSPMASLNTRTSSP